MHNTLLKFNARTRVSADYELLCEEGKFFDSRYLVGCVVNLKLSRKRVINCENFIKARIAFESQREVEVFVSLSPRSSLHDKSSR